MKTGYTRLIESIRKKEWHDATQQFRDIMEQKVAAKLAEERELVGRNLTEAPRSSRGGRFRA
jgi:hypothetical protein